MPTLLIMITNMNTDIRVPIATRITMPMIIIDKDVEMIE